MDTLALIHYKQVTFYKRDLLYCNVLSCWQAIHQTPCTRGTETLPGKVFRSDWICHDISPLDDEQPLEFPTLF